MSIAPKDLGWMAGVIDLKGRISLKNNHTRATKQAVLCVQSTEIPVITRLGQLTGTSPEIMKDRPLRDFMRKNCTSHCPEAHVHIGDENLSMPSSARWTITGAGLVVVLHNLIDMLSTDRGFGIIMNATMTDTTVRGPGAGMVRAQLRRLRDLGWDMPDRYVGTFEEKELPATADEIAAMLEEMKIEQEVRGRSIAKSS